MSRPEIDPDHSDTEVLTEEETAQLLVAARTDSPRAYALLAWMYFMAMRVDSALGAQVEDLGYDAGHRTLSVRLKGGRRKKKALPPQAAAAIDRYLAGRRTGPLFATRTGQSLDESYVRKLIRRLALKAGLPQADTIHPHVMKHNAVTHALDSPGAKLHVVQDFADHKDPRTTRRYDRRRNRLAGSPGYALGFAMAEQLGDDEDALFGVGS